MTNQFNHVLCRIVSKCTSWGSFYTRNDHNSSLFVKVLHLCQNYVFILFILLTLLWLWFCQSHKRNTGDLKCASQHTPLDEDESLYLSRSLSLFKKEEKNYVLDPWGTLIHFWTHINWDTRSLTKFNTLKTS